MSYLKDAKIIKTIAETHNCRELTEDACRFILAEAELSIRRVIIDSLKYSRKFNRSKIKPEDIDIALSDLNIAFLIQGLSKPVVNKFVRSDKMSFELDKQEICIKDDMRAIISNRLLRKKKMEISFDWLTIEGKPNPYIEGLSTKEHSTLSGQEKARGSSSQLAPQPEQPQGFERPEFINYDYLSGKSNKNIFLVKELNPNVLTQEASLFFETFRKIIEEYFQMIDQKLVEIDYRKFHYGWLISSLGHQKPLKNPGRSAFDCLLCI
jgi:hypothetical protein